jgi:hypothetical protein
LAGNKDLLNISYLYYRRNIDYYGQKQYDIMDVLRGENRLLEKSKSPK